MGGRPLPAFDGNPGVYVRRGGERGAGPAPPVPQDRREAQGEGTGRGPAVCEERVKSSCALPCLLHPCFFAFTSTKLYTYLHPIHYSQRVVLHSKIKSLLQLLSCQRQRFFVNVYSTFCTYRFLCKFPTLA